MSFGRRRHNPLEGGGGGDGHGDLLITPLLDLFVALIPFLIMSTVLVKINIVDVSVSKPVAVVKKSKTPFNLHLKVGLKNAKILLNRKLVSTVKIDAEGEWLKSVHKSLVDIKKVNLDRMEIRIEPTSPKVKLEKLMAVMDTARTLKQADGELYREDEESGQKVRLRYLFPKVILRGVYT